MGNNPEVLLPGQVPPADPHQVGARAHLNPEGLPLYVSLPVGRSDTNTIATRGDPLWTHCRVVDISGSTGPVHRVVRNSIMDYGRAPAGVAQVGDTGKLPRHITVVETGQFDKNDIPRVAPPSGADMDENGATTKSSRGVYRYRVSGIYLESLLIHNKQPTTFLYHIEQLNEWFQIRERDGDGNLGGKAASKYHRAVS